MTIIFAFVGNETEGYYISNGSKSRWYVQTLFYLDPIINNAFNPGTMRPQTLRLVFAEQG
jgi:hypothetical protein